MKRIILYVARILIHIAMDGEPVTEQSRVALSMLPCLDFTPSFAVKALEGELTQAIEHTAQFADRGEAEW